MGIDCKYTRIALFLVFVAGWIGLVVYLWQVDSPEFGAAAIGAGPVLLYALFQEYVQRPIVVPEGEIKYEITTLRDENPSLSNLPDLRKAVLATFPNTQFDLAYPVITTNIEVENKGLTTAQDCYCYFSIDDEGTNYGRWGDEANTQTTDLHPGAKRTVSLVRIYPIDFELWNMGAKSKRNYIIRNSFKELEPGRITDGVKINGYEYRVQRPLNIRKEKRMLNNPSGTFAGYGLSPKEIYTLNVGFGAEDYNKDVREEFEISLRDAIKKGNWEPDLESHYPTLVEELADIGWNIPNSKN